MRERKNPMIILFILFALPIPISLISWIGTLVSIAALGTVDWSIFGEWIQTLAALITMLLAGTYFGTYIFSLKKSFERKSISLISFFPLLHIGLFGIFVSLWAWLNTIF